MPVLDLDCTACLCGDMSEDGYHSVVILTGSMPRRKTFRTRAVKLCSLLIIWTFWRIFKVSGKRIKFQILLKSHHCSTSFLNDAQASVANEQDRWIGVTWRDVSRQALHLTLGNETGFMNVLATLSPNAAWGLLPFQTEVGGCGRKSYLLLLLASSSISFLVCTSRSRTPLNLPLFRPWFTSALHVLLSGFFASSRTWNCS